VLGPEVGVSLCFGNMEKDSQAPNPIVETAVQVLANHIPRLIRLDDPLIGDGIRDVCQRFLFV
jgi:hypothetical protein